MNTQKYLILGIIYTFVPNNKLYNMLNISYISANKKKVLEGLAKRNFPHPEYIDELLKMDTRKREIQTRTEQMQAESNALAKEIGNLFRNGQGDKAQSLKEKTGELKQQIKEYSAELEDIKNKIRDLLYEIPNIPHESVPAGTNEEDNEEIYREGEIMELPDTALPHWEIAEKYKLIDFKSGVKLTGAGFPVYRGKGAVLQRALINFFLTENTKAGYEEIQPPLMVNEASGYGTGQLPDKEGQMYHITKDNLYLIPTAEVPVTNLYRDVLLKENDFPIMNTAYTPCFRREAGSYGSHVRGLNRLHQFDKVEIVRIEHPDRSYQALDEMVEHVKKLLQALELPYRILRLCGGDLGFTSALTYDFEVWSAAQKRWLEVSSVSNFESFQSQRLKLRFKNEKGKSQSAHTLNGSALALPRIVAALLENNQTSDGINIPKALIPYTGFDIIN
jgi:seryl-tRNA synthetase